MTGVKFTTAEDFLCCKTRPGHLWGRYSPISVEYRGSVPRHRAAGAWSRPFTSI